MYWDCVRSFIWGILYIFVTFYFSERGKAGSLRMYKHCVQVYIWMVSEKSKFNKLLNLNLT